MTDSSQIVNKAWNFTQVLRDDGLSPLTPRLARRHALTLQVLPPLDEFLPAAFRLQSCPQFPLLS